MIKIFDNLISSDFQKKIYNEVKTLNYIPEKDFPSAIHSVGLSSNIDKRNFTYTFLNNIFLNVPELFNKILYRAYVNKFLPKEIPFFHKDYETEDSYTALYYSDNQNFALEELGETSFYIKEIDEIKGILAIPGRIVVFNSN